MGKVEGIISPKNTKALNRSNIAHTHTQKQKKKKEKRSFQIPCAQAQIKKKNTAQRYTRISKTAYIYIYIRLCSYVEERS